MFVLNDLPPHIRSLCQFPAHHGLGTHPRLSAVTTLKVLMPSSNIIWQTSRSSIVLSSKNIKVPEAIVTNAPQIHHNALFGRQANDPRLCGYIDGDIGMSLG